MPKKKIADKEPVVAVEGARAAAPAKAAVKKPRAPRATATKTVTHKHKKTTTAATPLEPVAAELTASFAEPTHEEIARLAYSFWEARGYQGGSQEDDWLRAVAELRNNR
jgi:hypothetical protein